MKGDNNLLDMRDEKLLSEFNDGKIFAWCGPHSSTVPETESIVRGEDESGCCFICLGCLLGA